MRKRAMAWGLALALMPAPAHAASELSVTNRLDDRRAVAAGTRAYSIGFEDGRFYANGWHITGEMGGIWTPPLKLADGVWFGIDDQWIAPATSFTSGRGDLRYALPSVKGLLLRRTDFVPDGRRAALFGLELANPGTAPRTVTVKVDAHSELLAAYPWTGSQGQPGNLPDQAVYSRRPRRAQGRPLDDHGHDRRNRRARGPPPGHDAAGRRGGRDRDARRRAREQADGARD